MQPTRRTGSADLRRFLKSSRSTSPAAIEHHDPVRVLQRADQRSRPRSATRPNAVVATDSGSGPWEAPPRAMRTRLLQENGDLRRTPIRWGCDQSKMMSRGRRRRASSLVPGNGGAPAPALARRLVHGGLLGLRDELDDMLGRIRSTRHIAKPLFKCPECGHIGRGADPKVSVRATILALTRFGVAAKEPARALEKAWTTHRKTAGLDLYGHAATSESVRLPACAHR